MFTAASLRSPAAVAVGVAVTILFGIFALSNLPIQLFPDIDRPQISIVTGWRSESPREVEQQIVEPEEEVLQGIPGLSQMDANAAQGNAYINLTFAIGTNMQATLVDVIGRLNRIPSLPPDSDRPFVQLANDQDSNASLLYVFMQVLPGNKHDVEDYEPFIRYTVVPRIEAIPGVGSVVFNESGAQQELDIIFDPMRAASLGIQLPQVAAQINASDDVSGGTIDAGRRRYELSYRGRYSVNDLKDFVLAWRNGKPVYLRDIADVKIGRGKETNFAYQNGNPALGFLVVRETGANVLATVNAVKAELQKINDGPAREQRVHLQYSFDPSHFINQAIGMVTSDLVFGIILAIGVLWFFMREWRATIIISSAIPICLFAVVVLLQLTGRTLNVVSLAGLAFATGMVLDAAIVALENILRLRERGMPANEAAQTGTDQVWGALLASTATNVAIFLPIIFLKDVEGQLFADLSLTIAAAVLVSLVVAITVVPTLSVLMLKTRPKIPEFTNVWRAITDRVLATTDTPSQRRVWIFGLIGASIVGTWALIPPLSYLPDVKRAAIDTFFILPPGASIPWEKEALAKPIMKRLQPYMNGQKPPQLLNYYVMSYQPGDLEMAVRTVDDDELKGMIPVVNNEILKDLPDTTSSAAEGSLFGGFDEGGGVSINIQSADPDAMRAAAKRGYELLNQHFGGPNSDAVIFPQPSLEYDQPQLKITPDDRAISEAGWSRADVGQLVQAFGEGLYVGQRYDGEKKLYLILKSQQLATPEQLATMPVATPSAGVEPMGQLISTKEQMSASGIYRLDRRRTIALNFRPPSNVPLGKALDIIRKDIEPEIRKSLPADGRVSYGAAASHLDNALYTMAKNFSLAVLILFLIMAALFKSARDAAIATIALPLGTVGGVAALRILNIFVNQPLDLLTMIGFIIVLGLVVNNTILLVARTRQAEAEGMTRLEAVRSSLETRLRPIFSSTLTAIFGMLPLVIIPGAGAEIYRGLGAVIVGGIIVSHVFTLVLIPAMLRLGERSALAQQAPQTPAFPSGRRERAAA
jgi:multidrug efflux pump subunit AcrB